MADAAARREARRKRILENSQNRLQLISGKSGDDSFRVSSNRTIVPDQDVDDDVPSPSESNSHSWTCPNNGSIATILESLESLSSTYRQNPSPISEDVTDTSNLVSPTPNVKELQPSLIEKIVLYKYDIVLLSMFLLLLHSVINFSQSSYIFLPVVIYSVTKSIWYPQNSDSRIANALRLMNHFSSSRVQRMIQISQYTGAIFSDICVFLFSTICICSLYTSLKESLLT